MNECSRDSLVDTDTSRPTSLYIYPPSPILASARHTIGLPLAHPPLPAIYDTPQLRRVRVLYFPMRASRTQSRVRFYYRRVNHPCAESRCCETLDPKPINSCQTVKALDEIIGGVHDVIGPQAPAASKRMNILHLGERNLCHP